MHCWIPGKEAIFWVQVILKTFAKQLHDGHKLCVFENQESLKTVNSVHTNISGDNSKIFATCVQQKVEWTAFNIHEKGYKYSDIK
jgi:mannitol-1-phosphate/altronate dehydrogenase